MIITKLKGGLGNQMFQYAAGLEMATKFKEDLRVDATGYSDSRYIKAETPRKYRLFPFAISGKEATPEEVQKHRNPYGIISRGIRFINHKFLRRHFYFDYHPELFKKKHSYIEGYFQSEKNFLDIREKIVEEFTLKKEYISEEFLAEKSKIEKGKSVSIHIRRGDYAYNKTTQSYHGHCSIEYYRNAIDIIKSKIEFPIFYFFSDDIEWVKNEFKDQEKAHFVSNPKLEDYQELMLMSTCSHNILANSSFSWWSAWLNQNPDKIVIAPEKWVVPVPSPQPNIIAKGWIVIKSV